jgi:hypothetical protein
MRTRRRATIEDLRQAVDCLPRHTRVAMLEGLAGNEIIVGAYATDDGICPMLAAHRAGGRTSVISFARAWDRFAFRDSRSQRSRRATERELLILKSHLEASLLAEDAPEAALAAARAEHLRLVARRSGESLPAAMATAAARTAAPAAAPATSATAGSDREPEYAAAQRRHTRDRPGDRDRSRELRDRPGWAWTRIVRRYDDYERVLRRLEEQRAATGGPAVHDSAPPEPALDR